MDLIREYRFMQKTDIERIVSEILVQMSQTRGYVTRFLLNRNMIYLYSTDEDRGVTISNLIHRLKDLGWIELREDSC